MFCALISANDKLETLLDKSAPAQKKIDAMNDIRKVADALETEVDDTLWPLPKYSEMLFVY